MNSPIPAYFSHSYRVEDREINEFFWRLFEKHGFAFTVDPQSVAMSTCRLEMMMQRSACFVAAVTERPEQPNYRCSPFIVYEDGLARQAKKPRLLFVERGVNARHFPGRDEIHVFNRDRLSESRFVEAVESLEEKSRAYGDLFDRLRGEVGLALPPTIEYQAITPILVDLLEQAGYTPKMVDLTFKDPSDLYSRLDGYDFVVIDVASPDLPPWLFPVLQGRSIPTLRLIHHDPVGGEARVLPELAKNATLTTVSPTRDLVVWWTDPKSFETRAAAQIQQIERPRTQFRSLGEGLAYFRSLGRAEENIFISNARPENSLAREIGRSLELNNLRFFHYLYSNTIEIGSEWEQPLLGAVQQSRIFVPLISSSYWQSEWCQREYRLAEELRRQGKITIIPYLLDESAVADVPVQGRSLEGLTTEEQTERIVRDLDTLLTRQRLQADRARRAASASRDAPVDIAFITVLPEEYDAVLKHIEDAGPIPNAPDQPNNHSWTMGSIPAENGSTYRVVLALGKTGPHETQITTARTIERFRPGSVLLVGIAGRLSDELKKGDVVVSDGVYGYEYGKLDDGFHPRPDWNYPTDRAVAKIASTFESNYPLWYERLRVSAPRSTAPPRIRVGPVASGSKVVDDLSEPAFQVVMKANPRLLAVEMEALGAVVAVEEIRSFRQPTGFATIRGISDAPPPESPIPRAQTAERDEWKRYAADAAATLAVEMIRTSWPYPARQDGR